MTTFSVYVPAVGQRDAILAYFATNGVHYLFDMPARIAGQEVDPTLDEMGVSVTVVAGQIGETLASILTAGSDEDVVEVEDVWPFMKDGVLLGWEVDVRAVAWDDDTGWDDEFRVD